MSKIMDRSRKTKTKKKNRRWILQQEGLWRPGKNSFGEVIEVKVRQVGLRKNGRKK